MRGTAVPPNEWLKAAIQVPEIQSKRAGKDTPAAGCVPTHAKTGIAVPRKQESACRFPRVGLRRLSRRGGENLPCGHPNQGAPRLGGINRGISRMPARFKIPCPAKHRFALQCARHGGRDTAFRSLHRTIFGANQPVGRLCKLCEARRFIPRMSPAVCNLPCAWGGLATRYGPSSGC